MSMTRFAQGAAVALLGTMLTGCIDATVDVELTSETTARATMTQVMGAEFYSMLKMSAEQAEDGTAPGDEFCTEGELTEAADGTATCIIVEEGPFADLTLGSEDEAVVFAASGPGLVRVSLPTAEMKAEIGAEGDLDAETRQMIEAFFAGHAVTVRFSGAEVVETNMKPSDDGTAAEKVIPFLDLINGTAELPDELYAVMRAP